MLYGKVLRPPAYGAKLVSIDLEPAKAMPDVVVVQDGQFVGVAAPTTHRARQALAAIAATAQWETAPHPSSRELFDHLRQHAQGGVPANPFPEELARAKQVLRQTYQVAYVQHAPLEPRVALAEWQDGKLTVWTGTQAPFGYHGELARTFRLSNDQVRVVVPDFGSGFGGKHTGEAAVEAARLARAAKRPVSLRWTREEEFTWAYFRPAALIDVEASLDDRGTLTSWHFVNINSGRAAVESPYRVAQVAFPVCRLGRPAAARLLPSAGRHRQQLCPRSLPGRIGGRRRRGPAGLPLGALGKRPAPRRAGRGGRPVFVASAGAAEAARCRRGAGLRHGERLLRRGLCGSRRRSGPGPDPGAPGVRSIRVRSHSESGQSAGPSASLHHHGTGPGLARGNPFRERQAPESQLRRVPGAAIPRRAGTRHPPAESARPAQRGRRRDADHRHRAGHRQRGLSRHRRPRPRDADPAAPAAVRCPR